MKPNRDLKWYEDYYEEVDRVYYFGLPSYAWIGVWWILCIMAPFIIVCFFD